MYKVEDFVIIIYCLIEDELYPAFCRHHGLPRRAGFLPALSDSECLAIELVGPYLGYASQKQLYEQLHDRWSTWFPALKDRVAFTRQCANLWQVKAWMHHHLVDRLGGYQAPCQIIDTLPVPICHAARRFQRRIFRTESVGPCPPPTQGYCAAKDEVFFGFKGRLRITDYGLIVHAPLLPAYGHDSTCCEPALSWHSGPHPSDRRCGLFSVGSTTGTQTAPHPPADPPQTQYAAHPSAKALYRPRLGAKAPTTHRNRLCPIGPTLPRPNHQSPRCVAFAEPMDHQNTHPFDLRMAQYTPQTKTAGLGRTRPMVKVTHHVLLVS